MFNTFSTFSDLKVTRIFKQKVTGNSYYKLSFHFSRAAM